MANQFTPVIDRIITKGLDALPDFLNFVKLIDGRYASEGQQSGTAINIPIVDLHKPPEAINASRSITGELPDTGFRNKMILLNQWFKQSLSLTDKEDAEILKGSFDSQISAATQSLMESVNQALANLYVHSYHVVGDTTTRVFTPANEVQVLSNAMAILSENRAPKNSVLSLVLSTLDYASALTVRQLTDSSWNKEAGELIPKGVIGRTVGFNIFQDNVVPIHVTGANLTGITVRTAITQVVVDAANKDYSIDTSVIQLSGITSDPKEGDLFQIAGHEGNYTVRSFNDVDPNNPSITISPKLEQAVPASSALTFMGDHRANLAFTREAMALVVRQNFASRAGFVHNATVDFADIMGNANKLPITFEMARRNFADEYIFSILYGVGVIRPEHMVRIVSAV